MADLNQIIQSDEILQLQGARLQKEAQQAKETLRAIQKRQVTYHRAMFHIEGLRQGVQVPQIFGPSNLDYWLFVRSYCVSAEANGDDFKITHLDLFLIPDLIEPQSRMGLPPGVTSGTVQDIPYSREQVVKDIQQHVPRVTLGKPTDVVCKTCAVCGSLTPIICHRHWEGDSPAFLSISLLTLCYQCPRATLLIRHDHHYHHYKHFLNGPMTPEPPF